MVDPIIFPIITLSFMGIMVLNQSGFSMSQFIPWIRRQIREFGMKGDYILKQNGSDVLILLLAKIKEKISQHDAKNVYTTTITHPGGKIVCSLPEPGYWLKYNEYIYIETSLSGSEVLGVRVIWEKENERLAMDFLDDLKRQVDPDYRSASFIPVPLMFYPSEKSEEKQAAPHTQVLDFIEELPWMIIQKLDQM